MNDHDPWITLSNRNKLGNEDNCGAINRFMILEVNVLFSKLKCTGNSS